MGWIHTSVKSSEYWMTNEQREELYAAQKAEAAAEKAEAEAAEAAEKAAARAAWVLSIADAQKAQAIIDAETKAQKLVLFSVVDHCVAGCVYDAEGKESAEGVHYVVIDGVRRFMPDFTGKTEDRLGHGRKRWKRVRTWSKGVLVSDKNVRDDGKEEDNMEADDSAFEFVAPVVSNNPFAALIKK